MRLNRFSHSSHPNGTVILETLEWITSIAREKVGIHPDRGNIFEPTFFAGDVAHDEIMAILGADWYGLDMIKNMSAEQSGHWRVAPLPDEQLSPPTHTCENSRKTPKAGEQG